MSGSVVNKLLEIRNIGNLYYQTVISKYIDNIMMYLLIGYTWSNYLIMRCTILFSFSTQIYTKPTPMTTLIGTCTPIYQQHIFCVCLFLISIKHMFYMRCHRKKEYDQEMSQSQVTDEPVAPRGRITRTQTNKDTHIMGKSRDDKGSEPPNTLHTEKNK